MASCSIGMGSLRCDELDAHPAVQLLAELEACGRVFLCFVLLFPAVSCVKLPQSEAATSKPATPPAIESPVAPGGPTATASQSLGQPAVPAEPTTALDPTASVGAEIAAAPCSTPGAVSASATPSKKLGYEMAYRIYLPPCYARDPDRRYPVLYLMHGLDYNESQWDDLGVDEMAGELIRTGELSPFIVVMPRDRFDSRSGDALVADLIPEIDAVYRTLPEREQRAIGGISRGAGWAIQVGLRHEELFGIIGAHSLAVRETDARSVGTWLDRLTLIPRTYLDIGERDPLLYSARFFHESLARRDIPHEWRLNPGGHTAAYWQAHMEEYLRWYAADW